MSVTHTVLHIKTPGQGLHEISREIEQAVREGGVENGICNIFIRHTSASLIIQENADPSAREDLEEWLNRHVPENDPHFTHTLEGADDMPSHIKSALTSVNLTIPLVDGRLGVGTWQGVYLWEHRRRGARREVVVTVMGE